MLKIFIKILGIGILGSFLGIGPNPQSPIPNPQLYYTIKYINMLLKENIEIILI
jgi:hypothetical protein